MPKGIYERTPEHNAAISRAKLGISLSPEHRVAVSEGLKNSDAVKAAARARGPLTSAHKAAMSKAQMDRKHSPETIALMSEIKMGENNPMFGKYGDKNHFFGKHHTDESKKKMSISQLKRFSNDENRILLSCKQQGISVEEWDGFISNGKYCPAFDDEIKDYIRDKYNGSDYISGLPAYICNPYRKLDVHHVDYDKQQGCDEHKWRLIPLSRKNHARTNTNRPFWDRLFTYALQYDETYYTDESICILELL